jgi:hypothetical protein
VRDRRRPLTDGHSGLRVVEVIEAAQLSLKSDGVPVLIDYAPVVDLIHVNGDGRTAVEAIHMHGNGHTVEVNGHGDGHAVEAIHVNGDGHAVEVNGHNGDGREVEANGHDGNGHDERATEALQYR